MQSFKEYFLTEAMDMNGIAMRDYLAGGIPNFGGPGYWMLKTDPKTGEKIKVPNENAFTTPISHTKKAMRFIAILQEDDYVVFGKIPSSANLQDASDKVHDYLKNELGDDSNFSWHKTSANIINEIGARDCDLAEYTEVCKKMANRSAKIEYKKALAEGDNKEAAIQRARGKYHKYISLYSIKADNSVSGVGVDNTINYRYN